MLFPLFLIQGLIYLIKYVINGGKPLSGEVTISGAKNAALPILAATVLADDVCRIENIPSISDVSICTDILYHLGADVTVIDKRTLEINPVRINQYTVPSDLARSMRASYYFIGSLLGRCGRSKMTMPGGCDFGVRPIDQHIKGFEKLGAKWSMDRGMLDFSADELTGCNVYLDVVSVGATINVMLAAVKAKGLTVIENAAREPHIVDLANFLNTIGADIMGAGTDVIKIRGVSYLKGGSYSIIPDQIEAGTYMAVAAATKGDITVKNIIPKHLESITAKLIEMGLEVTEGDEEVRVRYNGTLNRANVKTQPHPGFPTDMQPQIVTLLCLANGTSVVTENVYDNRFRYVDELKRMGANITVDGRVAVIEGIESFSGAPVKAVDLRAGAAMLIAGVAAPDKTEIEDVRHIERGYEDVVEKFRALGADIKRIDVPDDIRLSKAL